MVWLSHCAGQINQSTNGAAVVDVANAQAFANKRFAAG